METAGSEHSDEHPEPARPARDEEEVSLLDILLVLTRNRTLIIRSVMVFTVLAVGYALLAPKEYTSSATVVRETKDDAGAISRLQGVGVLQGLGLNLGGVSGGGLTPAAFPNVLESREVRLAVVRDTFSFPDAQRPMTFLEYVSRPPGIGELILRYTIKLPWTVKNALSDALSSSAPAGASGTSRIPSEEEVEALEILSEMVSTSVNQQTGLMTISVTASGPVLARDLTESFVRHLTQRIRRIRTEKVREQLQFIENRFQEVDRELEVAEEQLARFLERNQNPTTATLRFQRERLQRQVTFKEQLYSNLQGQLTQARIDLQRQQPVVTVVEEPVPPRQRSAPRRTVNVILGFLLGGIVGIAGAFARSYVKTTQEEIEEREKVKEIQETFSLNGLMSTFWQSVGLSRGREDSLYDAKK
jgi:uncharacterized protein involved in exopolysaccharide biosynthesis